MEHVCPLFWGLNPSKQGPFQAKQGSFGFQVGGGFKLFVFFPDGLKPPTSIFTLLAGAYRDELK